MAETALSTITTPVASSQPAIVVHHLEDSRSQRILWLLEELNIPYEIKKYKRLPSRLAPKELLDVHPLGKSPVITDGDITLAESGAIVEYLIQMYGTEKDKVSPSEGERWRNNIYFTHYPEGTVQPILVRRLMFSLIPGKVPALLRPIVRPVFSQADELVNVPDLKRNGTLIEEHLKKVKASGCEFFAGGTGTSPTAADYMMILTTVILATRAKEFCGEETIEYVKRIQARDAYKRALEKSGDYVYVLKE
ncbi:glutathione S-transferase [Crepidotus variabilis]|uniref:glutathione transferase n=1 Tax=Crepidotus variabilis TaxID=179855 RepID=A0A9P6JJM9_9AGAR|nr:glutathione S-transferase [Crepidotus variabilis]